MDLFEYQKTQRLRKNAPLADRMRPQTLDQYIGQEHIIGPGRLLRRAIQIDQLSSLIFYGPPGTGKTTLARIIANTTKAKFISLNAVLSGVQNIRDSIKLANDNLALYGKRTILFIDEVHRFNKAQQDALLPHVENGIVILIGATTENPYFEVNKALVSRSKIFQLKSLSEQDLINVAKKAIEDSERGYGDQKISISNDALLHLVHVANGDARGVLNALELAIETTQPQNDKIVLTREIIEESIQQKAVLYDKDGDAHYDIISAFIKSIRGSDPDAALYWMAKMIYAGEDPRFIFRRLIILASEDVGLADPNALNVVISAAKAFDYIGMPEGRFPLAQACLYLATAPKSNTTMAFFAALNSVEKENQDEVPNHLKDSHRDKEDLGHGKGYLYPHAYRDHWTAQQYLPGILQGKTFYNPSDQGYEKKIKNEVARRREANLEAMVASAENDIFFPDEFKQTETSKQMWERRRTGFAGQQIAFIRDKIIELADIQRDSLVLDCNAKTGLLTFEAARLSKEGGVWAATHDAKSYDTMSMMSHKMSSFEKPEVIRSSYNSIVNDITKAAKGKVLFNRIIGRNIFPGVENREEFFLSLDEILTPEGKVVFCETVHQSSTRICDFFTIKDPQLYKIFKTAEDKFFSNKTNLMVNWDTKSIIKTLKPLSDIYNTKYLEIDFPNTKRFTKHDLEFWMRQTQGTANKSLGDFIRLYSKGNEWLEIQNLLFHSLANQSVEWKTKLLFLVFQRRQGVVSSTILSKKSISH